MTEREIAGIDILKGLSEILEEIRRHETVFLVKRVISGLVSPAGEIVFVLGPPRWLGAVFGLIDEEYGWPEPIQVSEVKTVADLMPGHRQHPMIYRENDCLAMSISLEEYRLLKSRWPDGKETSE